MTYPSVQSMKDALGEIVLLLGHSDTTGEHRFTFDMLPADAQLAIFRWINTLDTQPK